MSKDTKIRIRVHVTSLDGDTLGLGTYVGEIELDSDCNELPFTPQDPDDVGISKIILDSGEIIYGFECWWVETNERIEKEFAMVERTTAQIHYLYVSKDHYTTGSINRCSPSNVYTCNP